MPHRILVGMIPRSAMVRDKSTDQPLPLSLGVTMLDQVLEKTSLEPRPYQKRIVNKICSQFNGTFVNRLGHKLPQAYSVMVESPTGSGKTPMALLAAKVMQANPQAFGAEKISVAVVAMRQKLLQQAHEENEEKGIGLELDTISMFATSIPKHLENRAPGHKLVVVLDECHHQATDTMADLHKLLHPTGRTDGWFLGMTATPFRTDRVKLIFEQVVKDCGIHQLISDGYLSQFDHFTLPDFQPETVAEFYAREPERWGKSVAYFHSFDLCRRFQHRLELLGHRTEIVTAESDEEAQLAAYDRGEYKIVTNMVKLTEGWDCPDLKTAFVRDSGRGCTVQMAGRAFRKHPSIERKQIVQSQRTEWPMLKTALPVHQFLWQGNEWRSLKVNEKINEISLGMIQKIANTNVVMPKFITQRGGKKAKLGWPPAGN